MRDWVASCAWVRVWWSADNLQESSKFIHTVGTSGSQLLRFPLTSIYLILIIDIYGCMCIKYLFAHPLTEISVVSSVWGWEQYHYEQRCTIWLSPCFHFCRVHSQWIAGSMAQRNFQNSDCYRSHANTLEWSQLRKKSNLWAMSPESQETVLQSGIPSTLHALLQACCPV